MDELADRLIDDYFEADADDADGDAKGAVVDKVVALPSPQAAYVALLLFRAVQLNRAELSDARPTDALRRRFEARCKRGVAA